MVCLPEGHRLAARKDVDLGDLREESFILYERKWAPGFHDLLGSMCQRAGFAPSVAQEIDEMYVAATLVATGAGVAVLPRMVVSLPTNGILVKPISGAPMLSEIGVATRESEESPLVGSIVSISQVVGRLYSMSNVT